MVAHQKRGRHALQSFVAGPKFRGVKMLPPGIHHVAYSAASSQGPDFAPTASFFFQAAPRGVLVKRWDPTTELLLDLESQEEVRSSIVHRTTYPCPMNVIRWC